MDLESIMFREISQVHRYMTTFSTVVDPRFQIMYK